MSTGSARALEYFAGDDGKQGHLGALIFGAREITRSAVLRHEQGVSEFLHTTGPGG